MSSFWKDLWVGDSQLQFQFPRLFALESFKDISVAEKLNGSLLSSFRRGVRGGTETHQYELLSSLIEPVILSNSDDRWVCDLNGEGVFCVKDIRFLIEESFLPNSGTPTRWVKSVPIKINVFAWKVCLYRLSTRSNLSRRNITVVSTLCPFCVASPEDTSHLLFACSLAKDVMSLVCRRWNLSCSPISYDEWLSWFKSVRIGSKLKDLLEGVFYVSWWCLWNFMNQLFFTNNRPQKDFIFDDIVFRSFNWCLARGKSRGGQELNNWASSVGHQDSLGAWGGNVWLGEVSSSSPTRDFYPFR
uniref:RNA-directed DNA polymerase, eukaryota n=1 Tax=Tanacetum cinerariifolium TaxID=118510 RepID=A0A699HSR6_TANCI|nr:RNA-directed DNA polymerase, eukaryota [Tanacetum cinerariifolium]